MKRREDGTIDPSSVAEEIGRRLKDAPVREARQVGEMLITAYKLMEDELDLGQLKLLNHAMKEMRYAYKVFNEYPEARKVSIFGSARTPPDHPDYTSARSFGRKLAEKGWMAITGAGDGIMKAGHEGPTREASFGLRIRLPFETDANDVIQGDPKLISFKYFFTRKLMFVSNSDAIAVYPGGFGTQDELFESLTLIQTGKIKPIPIVLFSEEFWTRVVNFDALVEEGVISARDLSLFHFVETADEAWAIIQDFYAKVAEERSYPSP